MSSYKCARCNTTQPDSAFQPVRCRRCGAVHAHGEVISPVMGPFSERRASPWIGSPARPVVVGIYECRFRQLDQVLRLRWTGARFCIDEDNARTVQCHTLISWRGAWL